MKKFLLYTLSILCASCVFCGILGLTPTAKVNALLDKGVIDVYLIGGQSNAVGYGQDNASNKISSLDSRYTNGFDDVLYFGEQERSGEAVNKQFQPVKLGLGKDSNSSGAEIGIASALKDEGGMNAVIKCAWGATHLYPDTVYDISYQQGTWTSPSYIKNHNVDLSVNPLIGNMYNRFISTVTEGLELLKKQGYKPVIKGMWWMQGEAEMSTFTMSNAYETLLTTLIYDVRNDVSKITGCDYSEMPFVFGLPAWNPSNGGAPQYQNEVRTAMQNVANNGNIINADYIDCKGLTQHDSWHFNAQGQKYLGESFIAKVNDLNEGKNANFNEIISIEKSPKIRDNQPIGLRFYAKVINYDKENNYDYGMIILPHDYLSTYGVNANYVNEFADRKVEIINLNCAVNHGDIDGDLIDDYYIQGSLTDIKYKNLSRNFTAIGYVKDSNGNYLYTAPVKADGMDYIASKAMVETNKNSNEYLIAKNFTDKAINYANGVAEENSNATANFVMEVPEEINVDYGTNQATTKLNVQLKPALNLFVKYTSKNPTIAKVDNNGYITAISAGSTEITVECYNVVKTVNVNVNYAEIDAITIDGSRDELYGDFVDTVKLDDNRSYSISAVKTQSGVFIYSEGLFNTSTISESSSIIANTNLEFKLNCGNQSYVTAGGYGWGYTQYIYNVNFNGEKYLHQTEIFIDKSLIDRWSDNDNVQLNYAWKTPNEKAYILDDMLDYWYSDWYTDWHSYHRLGGIEATNGLIGNLYISDKGLKTNDLPENAHNVDGVISYGEYKTGVMSERTNTIYAEMYAVTQGNNLLLGFEITHDTWSKHNGNVGEWWKNDNIEIHVDGQIYVVMFFNGEVVLPGNIAKGATKTIDEDGKKVTTVELLILGYKQDYRLNVGMNGDSFGWASFVWGQFFAYATPSGLFSNTPTPLSNGVVLDGKFEENVWNETVLSNKIVTTANGAKLEVYGTIISEGILLIAKVEHTVAPEVSFDGSYQWHTFLNVEFRLNGSSAQIFAGCNGANGLQESYSHCFVQKHSELSYTSYFEIFVPHETIGTSATQKQISLSLNGWFETGWCWIFQDNWNTTHTLTVNGITKNKAI